MCSEITKNTFERQDYGTMQKVQLSKKSDETIFCDQSKSIFIRPGTSHQKPVKHICLYGSKLCTLRTGWSILKVNMICDPLHSNPNFDPYPVLLWPPRRLKEPQPGRKCAKLSFQGAGVRCETAWTLASPRRKCRCRGCTNPEQHHSIPG